MIIETDFVEIVESKVFLDESTHAIAVILLLVHRDGPIDLRRATSRTQVHIC